MNTVVVATKKVSPSKVICIGRNYVEHISELGNEIPEQIVVFLKPNSAISSKLIAFHQEPLHYEAELCFMVKHGKLSAVGFGLDLTKRTLQSQLKAKGLPWERAKAFNGAAVFSEFVELKNLESESLTANTMGQCHLDSSLSIELMINDEQRQAGGIALMMVKPEQILREVEDFMQLQDGDIIMTGTPKGVGVINTGDVFEGRVICEGKTLLSKKWLAQ
jgi:2-keto-4-pentenoate hydratase/2-oxohepta-3-ene-1,7-dioic acid hydratase in catechol pathway